MTFFTFLNLPLIVYERDYYRGNYDFTTIIRHESRSFTVNKGRLQSSSFVFSVIRQKVSDEESQCYLKLPFTRLKLLLILYDRKETIRGTVLSNLLYEISNCSSSKRVSYTRFTQRSSKSLYHYGESLSTMTPYFVPIRSLSIYTILQLYKTSKFHWEEGL